MRRPFSTGSSTLLPTPSVARRSAHFDSRTSALRLTVRIIIITIIVKFVFVIIIIIYICQGHHDQSWWQWSAGQFKEQRNTGDNWLAVEPHRVPSPRPGGVLLCCSPTWLSSNKLRILRDHILLESVTIVWAKERQPVASWFLDAMFLSKQNVIILIIRRMKTFKLASSYQAVLLLQFHFVQRVFKGWEMSQTHRTMDHEYWIWAPRILCGWTSWVNSAVLFHIFRKYNIKS